MEDQVGDTDCAPVEFTVQCRNRHTNNMFHHRMGSETRGEHWGCGHRGGTSHNQGGEGFLGMVPQMASRLTCTIPETLLEGCQEPCLLAAPASQSPLLLDAVSAEPNASSATPQPHPAPHGPSKTPAGACLPWQAQPKDQLKTPLSKQA